MRFLVFGGGALGSVVAARLAGDHDVTLVARESHVAAIRERGLRITGHTERSGLSLRAVTSVDESVPAPDFVLVTTKSHASATAAEGASRFAERAIFVSLQNGLGNEDVLAGVAARVLAAVINQGATLLGPGRVHHAGARESYFGPFQGTGHADAERLAEVFRASGMEARAVTDIETRIWHKVVLNAAVNPLTALLGLRTGELLGDDDLEAAIAGIVGESVRIAKACGVTLDAAAIVETVRAVAAATRENKSSMLQDLERGRRTEIHEINGALAERARRAGVDAPRNELLAQLIASAERRPVTPRDGGSS